MSVVIPDEILYTARMTEAELKQEIAVMLFQREKLTLAQASQLAGMNRLQFQHLLASRQIPVHYDVAEFEADIKTLREMGKLWLMTRLTTGNRVQHFFDNASDTPWPAASRHRRRSWDSQTSSKLKIANLI